METQGKALRYRDGIQIGRVAAQDVYKRQIIDAILNGDINNVPTKKIPYFDFEVPTVLNGVDTGDVYKRQEPY